MAGDRVIEDRRRSERLEILGDLHGEVTVIEEVEAREMGANGVLIETRAPLQINSLHMLRLVLGDRPVVVKGRVVHCHVAEVDQDAVLYRAGIEFVDLQEPVHAAIREFLHLVKAVRNGAH